MDGERVIYSGRPQGEVTETEKQIYDFLDGHNISFSRLDRIKSDGETEDVYTILGIRRLKNLLLCNAQRSAFYLLVMPADVPFKSAVLSSQMGTSRFKFAPEEYLDRYLHAHHGTSSIMGLVFDKENKVKLLIDSRVLEEKYIGCLPCTENASLRFEKDDILNKFLPAVLHDYTVVTM